MIVEYVRYRTSDPEGLEAAYTEAEPIFRASQHCLRWELTRCREEPSRYVLRIEWKSLEGHLDGFRRTAEFGRFYALVKPSVAEIEEMHHYDRLAVNGGTLCEAVGGPEVVFRIARRIHEAMVGDTALGARFASTAESHVPHLGMWLTEVLGGPRLYSAVHDDIAPMLGRHANQSIREEERARFVERAMEAVRAECSCSIDHPAIAAIERYLEWGSRVAVANSDPGHAADVGAGVPLWDWESR